jgi:hypothetical protein
MIQHTAPDAAAILRDGDAIDRAIVAAHRQVILRHRQMGTVLAIWREGRVIEVAPESLELPPDDGNQSTDERKEGSR